MIFLTMLGFMPIPFWLLSDLHHEITGISMTALVALAFMAAFYLVSFCPDLESGFALAVGTGLVGLGLLLAVALQLWDEETHTPLEYRGLVWIVLLPMAALGLVSIIMVSVAIKCQVGLGKESDQNREFIKKCALATEAAPAILGIVWAISSWLRIPSG